MIKELERGNHVSVIFAILCLASKEKIRYSKFKVSAKFKKTTTTTNLLALKALKKINPQNLPKRA